MAVRQHALLLLWMKPLLLLLLCVSLLGCRKQKPDPTTPTATEAADAALATSPDRPAPIIPSTAPRPAGDHPGEPANPKEVRTAYHQYFDRMGSFPTGWQDMVKRKQLPAVPQGKNGQPLDFKQFTLWEAGRPPQ
ncbi:MAG: hypothetical protein EBS05_05425 [Proteobacteria bacterium]|nr:hypothetical protein [Pseudomonadota bacterium]